MRRVDTIGLGILALLGGIIIGIAIGDSYPLGRETSPPPMLPVEVMQLWDKLGIEGVSLGYWENDGGCGVHVDMRDGEDVCVAPFEGDWP